MLKKKNRKLIIVCAIIIAIVIATITAIVIIDCSNDKTKLLIRPTEEYVIDCLNKVPGIIDIEAVTEETDPMNNLNKPGWYISHIYFSHEYVDKEELIGNNLLENGTDAGGSIEIYNTKEDAKERDEYLAQFDGSILDSGSHVAIGTIVVRTSSLLTVSQQKLLETNIISALLGELETVKDPATGNNTPPLQDNDIGTPITPPAVDPSIDMFDDSYVGNKYKVNIVVDFTPNLFFNLYDVNLRIDGRIFETLINGEDGDYEYDLKPGIHTISFTKANDAKVNGIIELDVSSDMSVNYRIRSYEENIELVEVSKSHNAYYTITFDTNGGELMESMKVKAGEKLKNPGRPVGMEEYQFIGWSADGNTPIDYPFYINSNINLEALWEKLPVLQFDECWERELSTYTIYILIDYYSDYVLYFDTTDSFVLKGRIVSGDLYAAKPATIEYSYGGETWTEILKYAGTGSGEGILIDGNGFSWEYAKASNTEEAELYLKQIGYTYNSYCDYDDDINKLNYSFDSLTNSYTITGLGTYTGSKLKVPTTYNSKPVTKIADRAFENNKTLKEIIISDTITQIGDYAFSQSSLKRIRISNSVVSLGEGAFYKCTLFENITFAKGCKLSRIEKYTFYDCCKISHLDLPRYITRIEDYAFYNGCAQYGIYIPEKCEYIGNYAFAYVQATSITFSSTIIKEIGDYAFAYCPNLEQINYWDGTTADWGTIKKGNNWHIGSPLEEISCYKGSITIN